MRRGREKTINCKAIFPPFHDFYDPRRRRPHDCCSPQYRYETAPANAAMVPDLVALSAFPTVGLECQFIRLVVAVPQARALVRRARARRRLRPSTWIASAFEGELGGGHSARVGGSSFPTLAEPSSFPPAHVASDRNARRLSRAERDPRRRKRARFDDRRCAEHGSERSREGRCRRGRITDAVKIEPAVRQPDVSPWCEPRHGRRHGGSATVREWARVELARTVQARYRTSLPFVPSSTCVSSQRGNLTLVKFCSRWHRSGSRVRESYEGRIEKGNALDGS